MLDYLDERQAVAEEWAEREREIVESFTQERLKSYYLGHPDVTQKAHRALTEAKKLLADGHAQAALVFAGTAIEIGYKAALLRPIVSGLVHNEALADVITALATEHRGLERFSGLLAAIVAEFAQVDLKTFVRKGSKRRFWDEMTTVASDRNGIVHRGNDADEGAANAAVAVADTLLNLLLPKVLGSIGLKIQSGQILSA
jgi:hypothetical protein